MTDTPSNTGGWTTVGTVRKAQFDTDRFPHIAFLDNVGKMRLYFDPDKNVYVDGAYNPAVNTCEKIRVGKVQEARNGKTMKISIFRDTYTIKKDRFEKLLAGELSFATIAHPTPATEAAPAAA